MDLTRSAQAGLYYALPVDEQTQAFEQKISGRVTQRLALALLLWLYLIVAVAHACLAPLTTGPDELAHYEYVGFIAQHGRLPLTSEERGQASYKSDQPPLYHLIAALPAALVDPAGPPFLKRVGDHNRRQLIERTRHFWGLYNTEDEQWPPRAEILRWQVGRWVAILFGAATVAVTFFIAHELFASRTNNPAKGWLAALGAAAVVAFNPRFALTGSMLNYETTQAFFAALFLWVLLKMAGNQRPQQSTRPYALLLGLFMGLAITAKLSAVILPLELLIALWLIGRRKGWRWATWLRTLTIAAAGTVAVVGWWFGFILYRFNTVARDGWWTGLLRPLIAADSSDATTNRLLSLVTGGQAGFTGAIDNLDSGPPWEWLAVFFRTFWQVGIEGVQPLGTPGLLIALLLCLLAAFGLAGIWRNSRLENALPPPQGLPISSGLATFDDRLVLSLLLLHLVAPLILPLFRYAVTFSLADTAQGRHLLFLAAPAFGILLVWGAGEAAAKLAGRPLQAPARFLGPGLFLLCWSVVQLWVMTWAYYPPLPVRTVPEAKAQASQLLNRAVNEYMTLVGFNRQFENEGRLLRLDLIWQATGVSPVDYLVEASLLDGRGTMPRQWLGYPADGRYPTRAWDVGDIVRDTLWLPLQGLPPGHYTVTLNLIPASLKQATPVLDPALTLTTIDLSAPAPPLDDRIQIWQNGRRLLSPATFRYRETILVTLAEELANPERAVRVVGPGSPSGFEPVRDLGDSVLFIVGPDWSTGDYELQISFKEPGQQDQPPITAGPLIRVIDRWQRQFTQPPIDRLVQVNFANQIELLGYDLGANRVEPGQGLPVTLYWQGLDWMGADYTIFAKLLAADQTVHGGRDRLPREGYSTLYWAPGEIVVDPFGVPVDGDAPAGVYYLNVGLYKQVGEQAISLPLVQDGQPIDATSINIGPIKVGGPPPGLTLEAAGPENLLHQPFGDVPNLTLLGYNLTDETGRPIAPSQPLAVPPSPGSHLTLTLYWRSEAPLPVDYTTFVHLRNAAGDIVAQKDQPPLKGAYPTSLWDPGEIIADEIVVPIPAGLPPGPYRVVVGMYDFQTGQRLTAPGNLANEVILTTVEFQ